jgi:S-adenosylmethionine:tRNA-ribosyltransferase-isomerase (queuine synthetase)
VKRRRIYCDTQNNHSGGFKGFRIGTGKSVAKKRCELVITPQRTLKAINGILTGWHEPKATHLMTLEAMVGRKHLDVADQTAIHNKYLWHDFGDPPLILAQAESTRCIVETL